MAQVIDAQSSPHASIFNQYLCESRVPQPRRRRNFAGKSVTAREQHNVNVLVKMGGQEAESLQATGVQLARRGFLSDIVDNKGLTTGSLHTPSNAYQPRSEIVVFFANFYLAL